MPYKRTQTYTTAITTPSWNLDPSITPFNATVACVLVTGPVSYKLQYTLDDLADPLLTDANAAWFDSPDIPAGTAASVSTSFITPVARVRLVIASLTGSLTLTVIQGLSTN
jgi:hypothetical protein